MRRDLALLVAEDVPVGDLCTAIHEELADLLSNLTVFDVYEGENVEAGKKSIGLGLLLQDKKTTLTDETVAVRMQSLLANLSSQFHVVQR